jgi:hypothetical protein
LLAVPRSLLAAFGADRKLDVDCLAEPADIALDLHIIGRIGQHRVGGSYSCEGYCQSITNSSPANSSLSGKIRDPVDAISNLFAWLPSMLATTACAERIGSDDPVL